MSTLEKYKKTANISYLTGIMLGINAIPDTAVLIDGPDCSFFKSDIIYNNHDVYSTLKSVEDNHRIYYTGLTVNNIIKGHEKKLKNELYRIKEDKRINFIFATTFPMAEVLGIQYDMLLKDLGLENQSIVIKGSIKKDRLDGYEEILLGLAKGLKLKNIKKEKNSVSIVGNLFDRNEGDCIGNIKELERLFKNIGLKVNTIWLSGTGINDLKEIEKSEYIISLPYGRKAAKLVSKSTGAKLIETCLPFSIKSTEKFLLGIGNNIGLDKNFLKNFIKEEKQKIYNKIYFSFKNIFFGKIISYISDPNMIEGFTNFSEILGFDIGTLVGVSNKIKEREIISNYNIEYGIEFSKFDIKNNDLVIKSSIYRYNENEIDFGFPNITNHYFLDYPYLGFNGALNFINLLVNFFLKIKNNNEN